MKRKTARDILVESFRELAQSKPVDKITVPNIIENCGYSKTTFYRLFKDKYDLMAWDYAQRLQAIVGQAEKEDYEWKQILWDVAFLYNEQKEYLRNLLLHTSGYESFARHMKQLHTAGTSHIPYSISASSGPSPYKGCLIPFIILPISSSKQMLRSAISPGQKASP